MFLYTQSNSKRVSTSHIPCVSQPAALFVDQRTDNMSFYLLHHPTSSFNTFLRHSLFSLCKKHISLKKLLIISHKISWPLQVIFVCLIHSDSLVLFTLLCWLPPSSLPYGVAVPVALVFTSPAVWRVGTKYFSSISVYACTVCTYLTTAILHRVTELHVFTSTQCCQLVFCKFWAWSVYVYHRICVVCGFMAITWYISVISTYQ